MTISLTYEHGQEAKQILWSAAYDAFPVIWRRGISIRTTWSLQEMLEAADGKSIHAEMRYNHLSESGQLAYAVMQLTCGARTAFAEISGSEDWIHGSVLAGSREDADYLSRLLQEGAPPVPEPEPVPDTAIEVGYTYLGDYGPQTTHREIDAPVWEDIRGNYPASIRGELESFLNADPGDLQGHIGIVHGPPGTGKTYWLRALAQQWKLKAHISVIVDTEEFFNDASYLLRIILDRDESRWHLIICEDAEEFIVPGAKAEVGQALSRVLNLGDGLLGQGLKVLVLFTTNARRHELHEAITRPGRCFLNAEIPAFEPGEASRWLAGRDVSWQGDHSLTLAEMYEIAREG